MLKHPDWLPSNINRALTLNLKAIFAFVFFLASTDGLGHADGVGRKQCPPPQKKKNPDMIWNFLFCLGELQIFRATVFKAK
jgi:hypothetical protein